jgi:hypothetical protein
MTNDFSFRLPVFLAYFIEYFIHAFNIVAGIIHKKLELGDYPYLVFYTSAKLIPDFVRVQFDGLESQLRIVVIKET